jgi:hypothetical protein
MTLLWRFLLKNTRFAKEKEIWLRLVLAKWTGQNLNTLRKEGKEKIWTLRTANCISYSFLYKALAKEFLNVDWEVEFAEYHSYFKSNDGVYIDFSDLAIHNNNHWYFKNKEDHDAFIRTFLSENLKYKLKDTIEDKKKDLFDTLSKDKTSI